MVIPLRDIQERHRTPFVTMAILVVNVAFFVYELSLGDRLQGFFEASAFQPGRYFAPGGLAADLGSMFLSMFLHGGWAHLLGNMLYLWIFADNVEDRMGHGVFLAFYLVCGVAATLAHAYANPLSMVPSIGASGAIAGVLGAYIVLFPRARVITLIPLGFFLRMAELPALIVLGMWFVMQLFSGVADLGARSAQTAGVAWWAHIGGFGAGILLGLLFVRRGRRRERAGP
jgi:membrane associated rhomboid family serine protease